MLQDIVKLLNSRRSAVTCLWLCRLQRHQSIIRIGGWHEFLIAFQMQE